MFKSILLLSAILISQLAYSQCQTMTERDFQSVKQRLSMNSRNYNAFQTAMDFSRMYCMTSSQARDIANFLANDRDKIDFLKSCYPNIVDKENFVDVMDAFRLMSSAFRLYYATLGSDIDRDPYSNPRRGGTSTPPVSQNPNCLRAMDIASFQNLSRQISSAADDRTKASTILNGAVGSCMMTNQISQVVSQIRDENIKLDVLKRLMPNVYDIENYAQAATILSSNARPIFLGFIQNPSAVNNQPGVTEIDFNNFLSAIQRQSFDKDKENYIRTYMKNAYLTTAQIKSIIKLLTYDSSKLDIAKFLFDNCLDKQNYFKVSEEFTFSGSKNDLNDYVKSKM